MSTSKDNSEGGDPRRPINYAIVPLWKYTDIEKYSVDGGGNKIWKCNFCGKRVKSSYSKVKFHLLCIRGRGIGICEKITEEIKDELKREEEEAENRKLNSTSRM
ncbi:ATP-dependent Clp protease ATP-binding subunit ClpX [Bienertia sinuspersici]